MAFGAIVGERLQAESMTESSGSISLQSDPDGSGPAGPNLRWASGAGVSARAQHPPIDVGTTANQIQLFSRQASANTAVFAIYVDGTAAANRVGTFRPQAGSTWSTVTVNLTTAIEPGRHTIYIGPNATFSNNAFVDWFELHNTGSTGGDTTPPETTITSADLGTTNDNTPTFTFTGTDQAGVTGFECRVYASGSPAPAFSSCASPYTTATLSDGNYVFEVRAKDAAGNVDATPAGDSFTVSGDAPSQGAIFVGAGDIADVGDADVATGNVIGGLVPAGAIAWTAGDNAYENGTLDDFNTKYEPAWGTFKARTWPTPGNHDYRTTNASGYKSYFDAAGMLERATPIGTQTYYAQDIGGWRWYFLDSNIAAGTSSGQYVWVQNDLNQNRTACMGAIWHHPVASSGEHGGSAKMRPIFKLLDQSANDVDLVLQGHDHNYERFAKINSTGGASATSGIEAVVVGTGGTALRPFMTPEPGLPTTVKRDATTHGVLKGVLTPSGGDFEFLRANYSTNGSFTDQFSVSCN